MLSYIAYQSERAAVLNRTPVGNKVFPSVDRSLGGGGGDFIREAACQEGNEAQVC